MDASSPADVGKRIRDLRAARGWSQEELAAAANVSRPYVSDLESGSRKRPGYALLAKVAKALGVGAQTLIDGTPTEGATPLDEVNLSGYGALPVYAYGACGDPTDPDAAPLPYTEAYPDPAQFPLITAEGFGVLVRGSSMVRRGIRDGCICWVNPRRRWRLNDVVLALVKGCKNGESGMVVKTFRRLGDRDALVSQPTGGDETMECDSFEIKGLVVWVSPPGYPPQPA